ncbi:hypothetical protein [Agrobacterium pusense]|uniref:hypothetical protein n=1 Tax=Agrobacterium pusense TaxID=648995 RepID=UPI002FE06AF7
MSEPLAGGRYVRKAKTETFVRATDVTPIEPTPTTAEPVADEKATDAPATTSGRKAK